MEAEPHIVDVLIAERAPLLTGSPFWPLVRPPLYALLGYGKARRMADAIRPLSGVQAMDYASDLLGLRTHAVHPERIPPQGRLVIVANHPTGLADGVALYDIVKAVRDDLIFFANSDAHRVNPRLEEIFIPVEWVEDKRTRERTRLTLTLARQAFEAERALAIFPAGRISRPVGGRRLEDPPWAPTAVSLARKYDAPILPVHVAGPWSTLFNTFDRISRELRDITLFHEMLNKAGKRYDLTIGQTVSPQALEGDPAEITQRLKAYVEQVLPGRPDQAFA